MSEHRPALVELRVLEGANLYFPRPAVKLTLDVSSLLDLDDDAARACVALMSDWFPRTTGEIVHVDGGVHAMGA